MCGIACYFGPDKNSGLDFGNKSRLLLKHRGPDDNGIYCDDYVTLTHTRLSILELSDLGHQPMTSSCGRYIIVFNGEIYNHLDLRKKYLSRHVFRGHSDTETILELFCLLQDKMLLEMVGMWAIIIFDKEGKRIFVSRSRFGQKPLYIRQTGNAWLLASEIKPLLSGNESPGINPTAIVEYLALGNYGHLGEHTFFKDIHHFPDGSYAWVSVGQKDIAAKKYWELPNIREKDKVPFDKSIRQGLHDCVVEAVLSQTLADVPIGITLSGGIDSSVICGILAAHYKKEVHIYTAQSLNSKYDETKYVDALLDKYAGSNLIVHRKNLKELSIKDSLEKYITIQEEPFGDPSIIAHGHLMELASDSNIKVILNGQGADELFLGYNSMLPIIFSRQLQLMQLQKVYNNLQALKLGKAFFFKTFLGFMLPGLTHGLRMKSRIKRRQFLNEELLKLVDESMISIYKFDSAYNVLLESFYGVHIPHLVHYDDRNAMSYSIEGRMPFLDHRIAEYVARIKSDEFLKNGLRKYILREACKEYIPSITYERKDKIGFYTPLIHALIHDTDWVVARIKNNQVFKNQHTQSLIDKLERKTLDVNDALQIWRGLSAEIWMNKFNVKL